MFRSRSYIKHSRQYFIGYLNSSNIVKKICFIASRNFNSRLLGAWIFRNIVYLVWYPTSTPRYFIIVKLLDMITMETLVLFKNSFKKWWSIHNFVKLKLQDVLYLWMNVLGNWSVSRQDIKIKKILISAAVKLWASEHCY